MYDQCATAYAADNAANAYNALYERPAMLAVIGDLRGKRVLDVGCGAGALAETMLERGVRVTGLELSAGMANLARHPCTIIDASAANFLAIGNNEQLLEPLLQDPRSALWDAYLAWEVECCRQPGAIDAGTHIIAVVQKRPPL